MNNRQAGRRRGRGGQRQGGNPGRPDNGNRIDNRARGNAAQLLEKYKNLAQDAQRSGDRVATEYYLQFADHYFRVLAESRSRMEEGQSRRQASEDDDAEGVEDFGFEGDLGSPAFYQQPQRQTQDEDGDRDAGGGESRPRRDRDGNGDRDGGLDGRSRGRDDYQRDVAPRRERENAGDNRPRREREASNDQGEERPRREPRVFGREQAAEPRAETFAERPAPANDEPRRRGRPRRDAAPVASEGFDTAALPPAISAEPAPADEAAPERPRRGRPRKVRDEEAVPPAA